MPYNKVYRKSQIKLEVLNMIEKTSRKQFYTYFLSNRFKFSIEITTHTYK
jgi:hypothetical protein